MSRDESLYCPKCGTEVFAYYQDDGSPMCCVCEEAAPASEHRDDDA